MRKNFKLTAASLIISAAMLAGTVPAFEGDIVMEDVPTTEEVFVVDEPAPQEGEAPAPQEGEAPAPEGEAPAPEGEEPAPQEETPALAQASDVWVVNSEALTPQLEDTDQVRFDKATAGLYGEKYQPIAVLATQVVAGSNYAYLCRTPLTEAYAPVWKIIVVYEDLEGNPKLTSIRDLTIDDLKTAAEGTAEEATGAWEIAGAQAITEDATADEAAADGAATDGTTADGATTDGAAAGTTADGATADTATTDGTAENAGTVAGAETLVGPGTDAGAAAPEGTETSAEAAAPAGPTVVPNTVLNAITTEHKGMTPIALLGKKGSAPVDYMVLCHGRANESATKESLCFVLVHEEGDSVKVESTSFVDTGWYFMDGPRTVISPDGVLTIRMAGLLWKMVEDPDGRFVYTDGANAVSIRHVANGESMPKTQIASEKYPEVYQVYYSTLNEVFIVTGYVRYTDANTTVRETIESVKLLREDSKQAVQPEPTHEFEVRDASGTMYISPAEASVYSQYNSSSDVVVVLRKDDQVQVTGVVYCDGKEYGWSRVVYDGREGYIQTSMLTGTAPAPVDPRGERTGAEIVIYPEKTAVGITIFEYTNGLWYDDAGASYVTGQGLEQGYIWYDEYQSRYFVFAYTDGLRITGRLIEATTAGGDTITLSEYNDGAWRDYRYVSYAYTGESTWIGEDGTTAYGEEPPAAEEEIAVVPVGGETSTDPDDYADGVVPDQDTYTDDGYEDYGEDPDADYYDDDELD